MGSLAHWLIGSLAHWLIGQFVKPAVLLGVPDDSRKLRRGQKITEQIVIGTPGKIKSLLQAKNLDPKSVTVFVLDEADNMVNGDMGGQVTAIAKTLPPNCQRLLFSATFEDVCWKFALKMVERKGQKPFTMRLKATELKLERCER